MHDLRASTEIVSRYLALSLKRAVIQRRMAKILSPEEILEEDVAPSPLQLMHKAAEEDEELSKKATPMGMLFCPMTHQRFII